MHMPSATSCVVVVALAALTNGCSDGKAPVKTYTMARTPGPLDELRALLTRYADGQPVGSEVTSYDDVVTRLRSIDGDHADLIDEGLQSIAADPRTAAVQARRLLAKLGPASAGQ